MKINGHPLPTNMVEVVDHDASTGPKLLTSERAKCSGAVDPRARVSASQLGGRADMSMEKSQRSLTDA